MRDRVVSAALVGLLVPLSLLGDLAAAQTAPGEEDVLTNEPQSHHITPSTTVLSQWPWLDDPPLSPATSCDYDLQNLWNMVVDPDSPIVPTNQWIERFSQLGQFPNQVHPSACFHHWMPASGDSTGTPLSDPYWSGGPLNYELSFEPEVPTLPPLAADVASSSSPLLPGGSDAGYVPMLGIAERETVGGAVDAVTGVALLSATDFELPFGGAVFRHTRTYSDSPSLNKPGPYIGSGPSDDDYREHLPTTRLWDWAGVGWMVSHNPLLLIDAAYPGLGGAKVSDGSSVERFPRRTYFIPDAHHAIPFDMYVDAGGMPRYEAPARFGASLTYNKTDADWDPTLNDGLGGWATLPHSFTVWLYNGAVKYTIVPVYEDVRKWADQSPAYSAGSAHQHPSAVSSTTWQDEQRLGVPYLGLTVQIEDRYGNRIVNEYCGFHQYDCNHSHEDPAAPGPTDPPRDHFGSGSEPGSWPYVEDSGVSSTVPAGREGPVDTLVCCQTCHRKGQIQRTLLYASGESTPAWTIVYSHRTFASFDVYNDAPTELLLYPYSNQAAMHNVRVYRGDKTPGSCLTVDFRAFHPDTAEHDFRGTLIVDDTIDPDIPFGEADWSQARYDWEHAGATAAERSLYDGDLHFNAILQRLIIAQSQVHPDLTQDTSAAGDDWVHEVKYLYTDSSDLFRFNTEVFPASYAPRHARPSAELGMVTPRLIVAQRRSRIGEDTAGGDDVETVKAYVYRYMSRQTPFPTTVDSAENESAVVSAVFEPHTIDALLEAMIEANDSTWPWDTIPELALALAIDDYDRPMPDPYRDDSTDAEIYPPTLRESATAYFAYWEGDDDEDPLQNAAETYGISPPSFVIPGVRRYPLSVAEHEERSFGVMTNNGNDLLNALKRPFFAEIASQIGLLPEDAQDNLYIILGDVAVVSGAISANAQRTQKIYQFIHLPEDSERHGSLLGRYPASAPTDWPFRVANTATAGGPVLAGNGFHPHRSLFHFPHRLMHGPTTDWDNDGLVSVGAAGEGLNRPVWYTVVDEYPSQRRALLPTQASGFQDMPELDSDETGTDFAKYKPIARRIIALNAMGYKVWERTYTVTDEGISPSGGSGHRVVHVHDDLGRVKMIKSYGWSETELDAGLDGGNVGLVTVFDYDYAGTSGGTTPLDKCSEPRRIGVQWGDNGDDLRLPPTQDGIQWLQEFYRDPERPEVVLAEVAFDYEPDDLGQRHDGSYIFPDASSSSAPLDPTSTQYSELRNAVFHEVAFGAGTGFAKAITQRASARSAAPVAPDTPAGSGLFAVQSEAFDDKGRTIARGRGLVADVSQPGDGVDDQFFVDWYEYDDEGRMLIELQDVDDGQLYQNSLSSVSVTPDVAGLGWEVRRPSAVASATKQTDSLYGSYGLERRKFPNGTETLIQYKRDAEQFIVTEITGPRDSGSGDFENGHTTVSRTIHEGRKVVAKQQLVPVDGAAIDPTDLSGLVIEASVEPEYDASGQPISVALQSGTQEMSFDSTYNQFGTVDRRREVDGTITRQVYDQIGRLERMYRGTQDWSQQFGAPPSPTPSTDNMALVETRTYGNGLRNATLLTGIRTYREQPDEIQKYSPDIATDLAPFGALENIGHDWRMREVLRAEVRRDGTTVDRLSVSYLDAMGRTRFHAIFDGAAANGHSDPIEMLDQGDVPGLFEPASSAPLPNHIANASEFLSSTYLPNLRRLTETLYDARGNVAEVREYDLQSGATASTYTISKTYSDHEGRPLWQSAPGSGWTQTLYDAFGREVSRSLFADDVEVSRSETEYDADDNPIIVTQFDRVDGNTVPTLSETNAVVTQQHMWYAAGKLVCVADLGTGPASLSTDDYYSNPTTRVSVWDSPAGDPAVEFDGTDLGTPASGYEDALITVYAYDDAGNQELVFHPDRTATRTRYDGWGNAILVQEGIETGETTGALLGVQRATFYEYEEGKLVKIGTLADTHVASNDPHSSAGFTTLDGYQITEIVYGADVVRPTGTSTAPYFESISQNNQWIKEVRFPGDESPDPASYTFTYYADGTLASRTDARDVSFYYFYDDRGRQTETLVSYGDESTRPFDGGNVYPADRIHRVEYEYDAATGELLKATAYSYDDIENETGEFEVSQSIFQYDENGRLLREYQQRGDAVATTGPGEISPFTKYEWDVQHASGDHPGTARLTDMHYPDRYDDGSIGSRLHLTFGYGGQDGVDDLLNRIVEIDDKTSGSEVALAQFVHAGSGMRVRRATHDALGVEIAAEGFGVAEDTSVSSTGYEHLDRFGRVRDHHWRNGSAATQFRSKHTMDEMGNRTGLEVTRVDSTGSAQSNVHSWAYSFDETQRLTQADMGVLTYPAQQDPEVATPLTGHTWTLDNLGNWAGDGTNAGLSITGTGAKDVTDTVGAFNEIATRSVDSLSPTTFVYDRSGNLVYDGEYWYRYDAWNRLIQIVEEDTGSPFVFSTDGVMTETGPVHADVVSVFAYDALGRLVGRQAPFPGTTDEWRTETYLYDGSRRIAERWRDPIVSGNGGGANGNQQNNQSTPSHQVKTQREYVYTPGYIDEFVVEIDEDFVAWPILQDANYNAVAMTDHTGAVVRQRVLSPYGRVMLADHPTTSALPPDSRIGHQGLFAERLDANTQADPLVVGGVQAWHNRNRVVLSDIGRFAQRDPIAKGQSTTSSTPKYGRKPESLYVAAEPSEMFKDGLNIYAYGRGQPVMSLDPSGLFVAGAAGMLVPGPGDFITGALEGLVTQYAANLDFDVEWASDFDYLDDLHTRGSNSWMPWAIARGVYNAFEIGIPFTSIGGNPLDDFLMGGASKRGPRPSGAWTEQVLGTTITKRYIAKYPRYPTVEFRSTDIVIEVKIPRSGARSTHSRRAWRKFEAKYPEMAKAYKSSGDYVWHHGNKTGQMQLIPKALHKAAGNHIGGYKIWGLP